MLYSLKWYVSWLELMLFNLHTCSHPKIIKGTLNNMSGQNKIKKGCKYGKLFITLEGSSNFKSMQYEMGNVASIITIKWGN